MGIVRYENATINDVTNGTDSFGEYTTTITPMFTSRALVSDVANSLRISEKYRVYQDLVNLTFNYTLQLSVLRISKTNTALHGVAMIGVLLMCVKAMTA